MTVPEHPKGSLGHGNIADELARGQQNLEVVVVSPAGAIYEGAAHWVTVPGQNGQLGRRRLDGLVVRRHPGR